MSCLCLKISNKDVLLNFEDAQLLVDYSWHLLTNKSSGKIYIRGWSREFKKKVLLHRMILSVTSDQVVDHINGNTLDNRRENLRIVTPTENARNVRIYKNNKSGFKGVSRSGYKWIATIGVDNKRVYIGIFETKELAAYAYNLAALKYHKEFAVLNKL